MLYTGTVRMVKEREGKGEGRGGIVTEGDGRIVKNWEIQRKRMVILGNSSRPWRG